MAHTKPERLVDKLPRIPIRLPRTKEAYTTYGAIAGLVALQSFNLVYLFMPDAALSIDLPLLMGINAFTLCIPLGLLIRVATKPHIPIEEDEQRESKRAGRHRRAD